MGIDLATYFDMVDGYLRAHPYERVGQGYFNLLAEVRPDLAAKVRGRTFDPFYKTSVKTIDSAFFTFIAQEW